jgi:hypothetical protein
MAIKVFWDDEAQTVVRLIFETSDNNWTWADLVAGRHQGDALAASAHHKVGMIMEEPLSLPGEIFKNNIGQFNESHPNVVVLVIVANIPMVRAIVSLIMKASPRAAAFMVMVRTLEEARIIVQQRVYLSHSFTTVK